MQSTTRKRCYYFIKQCVVLWGHKIALECKTDDHLSKLTKEWDDATEHLSEYQFKAAVRQVRENLTYFPTIAEFMKFVPEHTQEREREILTVSEADRVKQQMQTLISKRNDILSRRDLDAKTMYTLSRAIDEQLATMTVLLRHAGIKENLMP